MPFFMRIITSHYIRFQPLSLKHHFHLSGFLFLYIQL
ncbi:hypothetical protein [Clostridium phage Villandry]|nr:hypothetical protein [Clostridium phage Villandry]